MSRSKERDKPESRESEVEKTEDSVNLQNATMQDNH